MSNPDTGLIDEALAAIEDKADYDDVENLDDEDGDGFEDDTEEQEYEAGIRSTIRAKWSMDGATTLIEAAELLRQVADHLTAMEADGWQLTEPVRDDYGFIRKAPAIPAASTD